MNRKKYEVADPALYDRLIAEQRKRVGKDLHDAKEWVELGRLYEAKIDMTRYVAKRNFFVRYFFLMYIFLISLCITISTYSISGLHLFSWLSIVFISLQIVVAITTSIWLLSLRYPPSGRKHFRRAIGIDPNCGEAYMYLGLISLRRDQKRKGCRWLEQAIHLGVKNSKIERELRSIYEKEFIAFFNQKSDREIKLQENIDTQLEQIRELRSKVSSLESMIESLSERASQAKWKANHKAKLLDKEMSNRISAIRQDYEEQIASLKRTNESREEAKELAERDFVRLTTEIMEAKAKLEGRSLTEAAKSVEDIMGTGLWQVLSEQTRSYLATAEQIHTVLTEQKEKPDYSLVGMELCKALEIEVNRALVEPFVGYLNGNRDEFLKINQTGDYKGMPSYFTYLAKVVDGVNFPKVTSLTLGQYHFTLKRTLEGEYALKEYGDFLDQVSSTCGTVISRSFLKKLEITTKKYRNTIVHRSPMNKKQCNHLRELIFAGEEALLKTSCKVIVEKTES